MLILSLIRSFGVIIGSSALARAIATMKNKFRSRVVFVLTSQDAGHEYLFIKDPNTWVDSVYAVLPKTRLEMILILKTIIVLRINSEYLHQLKK